MYISSLKSLKLIYIPNKVWSPCARARKQNFNIFSCLWQGNLYFTVINFPELQRGSKQLKFRRGALVVTDVYDYIKLTSVVKSIKYYHEIKNLKWRMVASHVKPKCIWCTTIINCYFPQMSANTGATLSNEIIKENRACTCNRLDSFIILDAVENPNWNILSAPCICKDS